MEGELGESLTHGRIGRRKKLTFPTNKFLPVAAADDLDRAKKSSGCVGTVGID
jgi:hypothetical protein